MEKISKYVKENYDGVFKNEIKFSWCHNVYGWNKFGVTPDGTAFICRSSHWCGDSMTEWFYHPTNQKTYEPVRLRETELVVRNWDEIKRILSEIADKERSLYTFEV